MNNKELQVAPVSVIIPCYCCYDTIARAVKSVVEQTVRPAELIILDDASEDETLNQLLAIQAQHGSDWIKVIPLPRNLGVAAAMNAGWEEATQPLIAFLDADDAWHCRKIEIQYGWMKEHPEVGLSGHPYFWIEDHHSEPPALPNDWQVTRMTPRRFLYSVFPKPGAMLRRNVPFRFAADKRRGSDKLLWMQIVLAGIPCFRLELPMVYLFKAPEGAGGLSGNRLAAWRAHLDTMWRLKTSGQIGSFILLENVVRASAYTLFKFPAMQYMRYLRK